MKKAISLLLCINFIAVALIACQKPSTGTDTATATTADNSFLETEPPFVLETEEEEPPEEIVYPYDNTHAYIFTMSDKKTDLTTINVSATREFNLLRIQPTNWDPIVSYTFQPGEQVDTTEYPYVAYRYKAKSTVTRGLFYVVTDLHPDYPDNSITWFDVDTSGEWTNRIYNMKEINECWEGKLTTFRIDPINGEDLNAEIYLDRVGFFKTEADAQAFLEAAEDVDYSISYKLTPGYTSVLVPAGSVNHSSVAADFTMSDTSLAPRKNGITPLVGIKNGDDVTPVPVSFVNGVGYISYMAETKGEYVLYYPNQEPATDADFVKVRGIMTDEMLRAEAVTLETVWSALRNTLVDRVDEPIAVWAASLGLDTSNSQRVATATDISKAVYAYLNKLDADVYVDPDYYPAPNAIKAIKVASGSGIITDITASSLSGGELAGIMTRLVKAMLDQPVLPSNIKENTIKIGGWSHMFWDVTDADIKTLAECGINMLVTTGELDAEATARLVLQSGCKYGVQTLLKNYSPWDYNMESPTPIPLSCYAFYDFDSYLGNHVFDEPGSNFFDEMAHLASRYHSALPGKTCFYNLLPMYANAAQLMEGAWAAPIEYYDPDHELYVQHVTDYAATVPGDYMCVDIYPLGVNRKGEKVVNYNDWLKNMDIFATTCRESNRDFWLYIQTSKLNDREIDYNDLRWQMYVGLSFGANTFIHFTYGDNLTDNGVPNQYYYEAQRANLEIMALSDEYMQYKNLGAFNLNCSKAKYKYAKFDNQYTDFDILKNVQSENPLLFGCFEKKDGAGYAFTVVNMSDVIYDEDATVSFSLEGEHTVSAWIKGEKVTLTPVNGAYTLNLDVTEGAFVVID